MRIKGIENFTHPFKYQSTKFVATFFGITENIELYIKQFLKFQAILCLTEKFRILREMNIIQRIGQGHQLVCRN